MSSCARAGARQLIREVLSSTDPSHGPIDAQITEHSGTVLSQGTAARHQASQGEQVFGEQFGEQIESNWDVPRGKKPQ
jgi:hypothetical protein